ncbi:MAG: signal peptidase I [Oligoflexia bacterium]|nr:signal peptidase I [Oligoflexia bacterium]
MRDELLVKTEDLEEDDDRTGLQRGGDFLWDLLRTWAPAILIVLLIRSVLFEPFRIPSGSMVPTLAIGDHILVTKYSYGLRWPLTRIPINEPQVPERGDVVVFVFPGTDMDKATGKPTLGHWLDIPIPGITVDYVKRVVGLPGDKIQVRQGIVYLNDQAQPQTTDGPLEFVDDRCDAHPTIEHEENLEGREHAVLSSTVYGARMPDFGPVTVPDGHIFAMGDNRDHSSDSRVWGFVPLRNIKGRARFVWLSYDQCRPGLPLLGEIRTDRFGETIR